MPQVQMLYNHRVNSVVFKSLLVNEFGIDLEKPVLVGFSGGPDSLCLLSLLIESGVEVIAAHLDHSLRSGSADEAAYVKQVCDSLGIHCSIRRVDVREVASQHHLSVEEAARMARYEFLFAEAENAGAQAVMTGHHADDQVETVLMHFLRGSALSGLAGMRQVLLPNPWSNSIPLVRPLLNYSREEIDFYLAGIAIKSLIDESNLDTGYFRNRIRHELIPLLTTYNPQIKDRILRMVEVIALEDDLMTSEMQRAWDEGILELGENYLVFDRQKVNSLHTSLLRRLVRQAIIWMDSTLRDIDHAVILKGSQFIFEPSESNRVDLMAGIEMFIHLKNSLVFAKADDPLHGLWPQLTREGEQIMQIPGTIRVNDRWVLTSCIEDAYRESADPYTCQLNAERVYSALSISHFKPGDRFTPYGVDAREMKLGDFWTNQGLAARARGNWPLIRCAEEVVWVPGFRIANRFKVEEKTDKIIHLELRKA